MRKIKKIFLTIVFSISLSRVAEMMLLCKYMVHLNITARQMNIEL